MHAHAALFTTAATFTRARVLVLLTTVLAPLLLSTTLLDAHHTVALMLALAVASALLGAVALALPSPRSLWCGPRSTTGPPSLGDTYTITDAPRAPRRPRAPGRR